MDPNAPGYYVFTDTTYREESNPYQSGLSWSQYIQQRAQFAQEQAAQALQTAVGTPAQIAEEARLAAEAAAAAAPQSSEGFGAGLGKGLSQGLVVLGVVVLVGGTVAVVGGGLAAAYFLGPELSAALATAKAVKGRGK